VVGTLGAVQGGCNLEDVHGATVTAATCRSARRRRASRVAASGLGGVVEEDNRPALHVAQDRHDWVGHDVAGDPEHVEGTDDRARSRMGRACAEWKPASSPSGRTVVRGRRPWPAAVDHGQVLVHDRDAGAVAVRARAVVGVQLEQLQDAHGLAGDRLMLLGPELRTTGRRPRSG
jgi:hypothetical protein